MTSPLKHQSAQLLLSGGGIGLALLAGWFGWTLAGPASSVSSLSELRPPVVTVSKPIISKAESTPLLPDDVQHAAQPNRVAFEPPANGAPIASTQPAAQASSHSSSMPAKAAAEQATIVNPALPGNFLVANGQRVSIQQILTTAGDRGAALDVVITPVGDSSNGSISGPGGVNVAPNHSSRPKAGLTHEQELFRAKWGWAAYNAANRAATWDLDGSSAASQ